MILKSNILLMELFIEFHPEFSSTMILLIDDC